MYRLGEFQRLKLTKVNEHGMYLSDIEDGESVLLPGKYVPKGARLGDVLEVFIYRDSEDRPVATTIRPKLIMGEVARLRVISVGKIGAFLDWGLEKDLLLPYAEMTYRPKDNDEVLVSLYIDKSDRLCARMNVYEKLRSDSGYNKGDRVSGLAYQYSENFGMFVAVDDIYSALVPKKELYGDVKCGDRIDARVSRVREDGRLELCLRDKAYIQMDKDAEKLLKILETGKGELAIGDKSDPEEIRNVLQMSKKEFKRAAGRLLKEKRVEIGDKYVRLTKR